MHFKLRQLFCFRTSSVFNLILEQLIRLKKEAFTDSQSAYITELVLEVEVRYVKICIIAFDVNVLRYFGKYSTVQLHCNTHQYNATIFIMRQEYVLVSVQFVVEQFMTSFITDRQRANASSKCLTASKIRLFWRQHRCWRACFLFPLNLLGCYQTVLVDAACTSSAVEGWLTRCLCAEFSCENT